MGSGARDACQGITRPVTDAGRAAADRRACLCGARRRQPPS